MRHHRFGLIVSSLLVVSAAMTGCAQLAPQAPGAQSAPVAPSAAPPATPAESELLSEPAAAPVMLPDCDVLIPLDDVRSALGSQTVTDWPVTEDRIDLYRGETFGPVAIEAMDGSLQSEACEWAYPYSDGIVTMLVMELEPTVRANFVDSLRDSMFVERVGDQATIFEDLDPQRRKSGQVRYAFVGNVWIASVGVIGGEFFIEAAIRGIAQANPAQVALIG